MDPVETDTRRYYREMDQNIRMYEALEKEVDSWKAEEMFEYIERFDLDVYTILEKNYQTRKITLSSHFRDKYEDDYWQSLKGLYMASKTAKRAVVELICEDRFDRESNAK